MKEMVVPQQTLQPHPQPATITIDQTTSSPRISFSSEFLEDANFISITPNPNNHLDPTSPSRTHNKPPQSPSRSPGADQFEFLSHDGRAKAGHAKMLTADELFFEGKLLPFWQMQHSDRLTNLSLKSDSDNNNKQEDPPTPTAAREVNWFVDDDPSPRPPKCTVLWKELLRLKKQRAVSTLSPSSSSSSTSSSSNSLADVAAKEEGKGSEREKDKKGSGNQVKRAKKGLERTRSSSIRIRPMINVPICTQMKTSTGHHHGALPPFFPLKKGRVLER